MLTFVGFSFFASVLVLVPLGFHLRAVPTAFKSWFLSLLTPAKIYGSTLINKERE
jgi:hypothetical protein